MKGNSELLIVLNSLADEFKISKQKTRLHRSGPPPMMEAIEKQLIHLKIDKKHIIKESF